MILTVTPNPSVDRVIFIDEFRPGGTMRASDVVHSVGGKALDASVALQTLGGANVALSFLAGQRGHQLAALLDGYGIEHEDVWVEGETRLANVIVETNWHRHSHVTFGQLSLRPEHTQELFRRCAAHLPKAAWVITGGSLPPALTGDFYAELVAEAARAGVPALVDVPGAPLLALLRRARPAILKINRGELCDTFGIEAASLADLVQAGRHLMVQHELPALALTCGSEGILALLPGAAYLAVSPPQEEVNVAGAGDAVSGALAHRLALGDAWPEALRWAAATSAAVVRTAGTADCTMADITEILPLTEVSELGGVSRTAEVSSVDTSHPLVLRPGRGRGMAFIVIGVGFGVLLAWLGPGGGSPAAYGAFAIIVVALWLGFGVYMVNPAHSLRLDARGMEIHTLRHTTVYTWQELGGFYAEGTAGRPMVTYDLAGANPRRDTWTRVTHAVTGGREVLPNTYGLPAEELARLLNEWREQVGGSEGT